MATNKIRFMKNNFASLTTNSITVSSEVTGFEGTKAVTDFRSQTWKTQGHFLIDSTNNQIHIDDGSIKVANVVVGAFVSPSNLATSIATALNAVSSGWSCSYDLVGETFKFTISNSGSVTLKLSTTTNAIWDDIGFTGTTDRVGTSFIADEQRNHTSEFLTFDFGFEAQIDFVALISDISSDFSTSSDATITLQANNVNEFASPPLTKTLTRTDKGVFEFIDDDFATATLRSYRYWNILISDKFNTGGPQGIQLGNVYLGSFDEVTERNVQSGFNFTDVDPSKSSESEAGALFFDNRTKFRRLRNLNFVAMSKSDRELIEEIFADVGKTTPFYVSIDSSLCVTDNIEDLTRFVLFDTEPTFTHLRSDFFSGGLSLREVV